MTKFILDWVENIVGKGENTGYQHFLLFPQCFQKLLLSRLLKSWLCGKELTCNGKHPRTVCVVKQTSHITTKELGRGYLEYI